MGNRWLFTMIACSLLSTIGGLWAQTAVTPVETDFKSDICQFCKMKVTDRSYAAQVVTPSGALFFDDYGCLIQFLAAGGVDANDVLARIVRSVAGDAWLAAEDAVWVSTKDVRTPMGNGFHAFPDKQAAESFVKLHMGAEIVTLKDLKVQKSGQSSMMKM